MRDIHDIDLQDTELNSEIELLADLIVTASESAVTLDVWTLDIVLGVRDTAHAASAPGQRIAG